MTALAGRPQRRAVGRIAQHTPSYCNPAWHQLLCIGDGTDFATPSASSPRCLPRCLQQARGACSHVHVPQALILIRRLNYIHNLVGAVFLSRYIPTQRSTLGHLLASRSLGHILPARARISLASRSLGRTIIAHCVAAHLPAFHCSMSRDASRPSFGTCQAHHSPTPRLSHG